MSAEPKRTKVELLDPELLLLDGQCGAETQAEVDGAKLRARLSRDYDADARIIYFASSIIRAALTGGALIRHRSSVRSCACCGKSAGYAKRRRSSSKGQKGDPNYDRPLSLGAWEYVPRFVRVIGYSGTAACSSCAPLVEPILIAELSDKRVELPDHLRSPGAPRWKRYPRRQCTMCGWTGHEGQMRRLQALLNGTYPGGCPECPAENIPFGRTVVEARDGFEMVQKGVTP